MYTLQKLLPSDLRLAQALLKSWQEDEEVQDAKIPGEKHLLKLLAKDSFHAYVVLYDEEVVGGLTAYELQMFTEENDEMFLYEIGINKQHRRQKLGKWLIEALKSTCREKGIDVIFVGTSSENVAAKRLYTSTGGDEEVIPWFTYSLKKEPSDHSD